jgi:hypothetical protein
MGIESFEWLLVVAEARHPYLSAWFHVYRSFRAGLKIVNRRITSLTQDSLNALHHQIMNFCAFIEGNFAQHFVDRCGKV